MLRTDKLEIKHIISKLSLNFPILAIIYVLKSSKYDKENIFVKKIFVVSKLNLMTKLILTILETYGSLFW